MRIITKNSSKDCINNSGRNFLLGGSSYIWIVTINNLTIIVDTGLTKVYTYTTSYMCMSKFDIFLKDSTA
eukprot:snap_masked-scaffold_4-processed-gene-8.37-mRNA-1 protein AED:1.00 eAED:1.00 QI:0/0/0/0/1/1/4/0/69